MMMMIRTLHNIELLSVRVPDNEEELKLPSVSYNLLRFLRAHLVHFLTRLIEMTIVKKELEVRQRRRKQLNLPQDVCLRT